MDSDEQEEYTEEELSEFQQAFKVSYGKFLFLASIKKDLQWTLVRF